MTPGTTLDQVFKAIEDTQTARSNASSQLASDQGKLANLQAAIALDEQNSSTADTDGDQAVRAGIQYLQGLLSAPQPPTNGGTGTVTGTGTGA